MSINGAEIQIESGNWSKLHNHIWEALSMAPLSGSEFRCLMFLFRKTYGWNKTKDTLSMGQWADGTGLDRRVVIRAVQGLLSKHVIIRSDNGNRKPATWGFNKYIEEWDFTTSDKNDTKTSDKNDTKTSDKNDTKTSDKSDTHKRYININKRAASTSDKNDTSEDELDKDGRFTLQLIRDTNKFFHFPADAKRRCCTMEETYSMDDIRRAVALLVERHNKRVESGQRGIVDAPAYVQRILDEEAKPKPESKPKRKGRITDPVTGEKREVAL